MNNEDPKIFKKYKYPDGRIVSLTKEEFDRTVEIFRLLIHADEKKKKAQFQSLSHHACGSKEEPSVLEPDKS